MLDTHPIKYFCALRVRLFWVKMISGNHFHPFPHVWLSRKISFSRKWLPVDQYFHLWPENQSLPSFSLQITSGKREREREREKREPRSEREERAQIVPLRRRSHHAARSSIAPRDWRARSSDAHRSSARSKNWLHFFCWVLVSFAWFDAFSVKIFEWTSLNLLLLF